MILSQISCGKVLKPPHICSFLDYLEQLKKKRKILRNWVHISVGRSNLENGSDPSWDFYTVLCRKNMRGGGGVHFTALNRLSITKVMNDFPYLWCPITCEPYQADHVIGHIAWGRTLSNYLNVSMAWETH